MTQKARVHEINLRSNSGHCHAVLGCDLGCLRRVEPAVCPCTKWSQGLSFLSLLVCFFIVSSLSPAGRLTLLAHAGSSSLSLSGERYFQHAHRNRQMLAHVSKKRMIIISINIFIIFALMFQELFVSQAFGCEERHIHVESWGTSLGWGSCETGMVGGSGDVFWPELGGQEVQESMVYTKPSGASPVSGAVTIPTLQKCPISTMMGTLSRWSSQGLIFLGSQNLSCPRW